MKTREIAGHLFPDTVDAVCQKVLPNGTVCGRAWSEIEHTTEDDAGKEGIAHIAQATSHECREIMAEKQRRDEMRERAWAAIMGLSKR